MSKKNKKHAAVPVIGNLGQLRVLNRDSPGSGGKRVVPGGVKYALPHVFLLQVVLHGS